jgi:hypothetical protein
VSAIQSQADPPTSIAPRAPWYVYVGAILLVGWGSLVLSAFLSLKEFGPHFWKAMSPVALELAIGLGLLLRRRWAWMLGITTSVVFIAEGLRRIVFVRGEYVVLDALVHYLVPAIVILICLLPGKARRAFLGDRETGGCRLTHPMNKPIFSRVCAEQSVIWMAAEAKPLRSSDQRSRMLLPPAE